LKNHHLSWTLNILFWKQDYGFWVKGFINKAHSTILAFILILSVIIIISRTNWLNLILRLELNIVAFLIIIWRVGTIETRTMVKYYIINRFSSILLSYFLIENYDTTILILLMIKTTFPPFTIWGIDLINYLSKLESYLFLTLQKIGFLILINNYLYITVLIIIVITCLLYIVAQTSLINILFFSSLIHSCWILVRIRVSILIIILYFTIYSIILWWTFATLNNSIIIKDKMILATYILVLRGLPPFIIFYFKWIILIYLSTNTIPLSLLIIVGSLMMIVIYFRVFYISLLFVTKRWKEFNYSVIPIFLLNLIWLFV